MMPRIYFLAALVLTAGALPTSRAAASTAPLPIEARDPWAARDLIEPQALARALAGPAAARPTVLCVGMALLYRSEHIPGAIYAGPTMEPEGLQKLKAAVQSLPHTKPIVIYCGCCPWTHCPNVRPAFRTLQDLGFSAVRVLVLPENFKDDWVAKGLPSEKTKT